LFDPRSGTAKEALEFRVIALPHLLVKGDNVGEALPDKLFGSGTRSLGRVPQGLGLDRSELVEARQ
jgi:hypothetical protein